MKSTLHYLVSRKLPSSIVKKFVSFLNPESTTKFSITKIGEILSNHDIIKRHFDQSIHPLLSQLFIFRFYSDNFGYILYDTKTNSLIGFDFGIFSTSSEAIIKLEKELGSTFKFLFTTHSHSDHAGGNKKWKQEREDSLKIFCGDCDDKSKGDYIEIADERLKDNQEVIIGDFRIKCIHTPGHLKSHVVYAVYASDNSYSVPLLFSGDTLFHGTVGKVFNGTYEELFSSINKILSLPYNTLIFPGHEYTVSNLEFNLKIDQNNQFILDKLNWAKLILNKGNYTCGASLVEERLYNSFLRCNEPKIQKVANASNPLDCFIKLRQIKDELSRKGII